jgi:hypothetical protein
MEMYHHIDGRDLKSSFENPYHNLFLVHEQCSQDEEFQHEKEVEDPSQFTNL